MTPAAFALILVSVFLHAGWNFLSKHCSPSGAFYLISTLTAVLLWLPFFCFSGVELGMLPGRFWILLAASGVFELLYLLGLAHAYRTSDISLAYPLARALPVLMVAGVTIGLGLGQAPGIFALAGMVVVSAGCLILPLKHFRDFDRRHYWNRSILFILLAAIGTTGYTVLDSQSMALIRRRESGCVLIDSITFLFMMESLIAIGLGAWVWLQKRERQEFKRLFLKTPTPLISGLFSSLAYVLILIAMGYVSNVSYVQAFRQMSLPLGVLAGVVLLKEKCGGPKLAGVFLIVAGLVMVALGR